METSLVENLHQKLRGLEHILQTHRHDLAAQFRRHCTDQLRDADPAVAANVRRAIARSLADYPMLRPGLDLDVRDVPDSPPPAPAPAAFQSSPPPAVSGDARPPVSPHDRENEFQGLFTPSYLPLLESSPIPPRSPTVVVAPAIDTAAAASGNPQVPVPASSGPGAGRGALDMDDTSDPAGAQDLSSLTLQRPHHARTSTEDTNSTTTSDRSDTKPPRSALRRSSSSAKPPQSPRRVRFEFMGAEVLPTSSPQAADLVTHDPFSTKDRTEALASDAIFGVDAEESRLPPPRKISSSEALRALSRTPLEEDTVWTVVNPGMNESNPSSRDSSAPQSPKPKDTPAPPAVDPRPLTPVEAPEPLRRSPLRSVHEVPEPAADDFSSSDEEFLAMGKSKSFVGKKAISPVVRSPSKAAPQPERQIQLEREVFKGANGDVPPHVEEEVQDDDEDNDDEDDDGLFQFESGGLTAPPKPRPRPPPLTEELVEDDQPNPPTDAGAPQLATYATSPAVTILPRPKISSGPPTPTNAKFQAGSLGSYKGRPLVMPVVRNADVHAQAASLGEFNTFVGGLDGRSGMDEGDLNSFRASFVQSNFSGTPRSFSERFMMEEANERRLHDDTAK